MLHQETRRSINGNWTKEHNNVKPQAWGILMLENLVQ